MASLRDWLEKVWMIRHDHGDPVGTDVHEGKSAEHSTDALPPSWL